MAANTKDDKAKISIFSRIGRSVKDMRGEMKRVVWPSKKQVLNNTLIVLVFMLISAVGIGIFDTILGLLRQLMFGAGA